VRTTKRSSEEYRIDYQWLADQCRQLARKVSTEKERAELLEMAIFWDFLADRCSHQHPRNDGDAAKVILSAAGYNLPDQPPNSGTSPAAPRSANQKRSPPMASWAWRLPCVHLPGASGAKGS
jgi:hypothetical protein